MNSIACDADAVAIGVNPLATVITTADQPESERFAFWRETLCNTLFSLDCLATSDQSFFGEIATIRVKEIAFAHIRVRGHNYYRSPLRIRQDRKELLIITLVLTGTLSIMQDGQEVVLGPGDLTCFDSTRPCSGTVSDDSEQILLLMPREAWIRRIGATEQMTTRTVRGNTNMGTLVSNFFRQVVPGIEAVNNLATADRLVKVSMDLVTAAFGDLISLKEPSQSSGRISLLYRAKTLIGENLHDPSLNPEKIAQALGISERYLQDLFREENATVSNWSWQRRLEKSHKDLADPLLASMNVSQIAFNCGFSDLTHFGRRFKMAFSMTPSEFRREQLVGKPQGSVAKFTHKRKTRTLSCNDKRVMWRDDRF